MKDTLREIVCEALQDDDCIGRCNYPHCYKVNAVVDNLIKHNVVLTPCAKEELCEQHIGGKQ